MEPYPFADVPLTPYIAEHILSKIYHGKNSKPLHRSEIVEIVKEYHEKCGGASSEQNEITPTIKKALFNMSKRGLVKHVSLGYWIILGSTDMGILTPPAKIVKGNFNNKKESEPPESPFIIEDGKFAIYGFYNPSIKELAELKKETIWPHKIGRTKRSPVGRINNQATSALPEKPLIAFIIYTDFPIELEKVLHDILNYKGRKVKNAPGNEWFLTNTIEIEKIYNKIKEI